jgi:hypothetical protein
VEELWFVRHPAPPPPAPMCSMLALHNRSVKSEINMEDC